MDQTPSASQATEQPPQQNPTPPPTTTTTAASSSIPPPTTTNSFTNPNSSPSPRLPTTTQSTTSQTRPPFNTRPWQQPPYSQFSLPSPPLPSSSASTTSSATAASIPPRGGMAIGVPAHNPSAPTPPPASFSSLTSPSYGQQSQIRPPMQGIGMAGALGSTSSMRPTGVPSHQLRPSQPSLRPPSSSNTTSPGAQNFQGHGMLRVSSLGSPSSIPPSSSQGPQAHNQPWLLSGTQGKPPLPTPPHRPQANPQSFQQRSHIPQQHLLNMPNTPHQSSLNSNQQSAQPSASGQAQEHYSPQFPASRIQQSASHQQMLTRGPGLGSQRPPLSSAQTSALPPVVPSKNPIEDTEESSNRIVSKRSIRELVNQVDPTEKLDPEVEGILADLAEDFLESITTFGCSLAKHRKSTTLEAKDILIHLERNWNITLPGFGGDEIRNYKKPNISDVHRERLAAVKKSIVATDSSSKSSGGPSGANTKGSLAKGPASIIGSPPNSKIREAA